MASMTGDCVMPTQWDVGLESKPAVSSISGRDFVVKSGSWFLVSHTKV